MTSTQKKAPKKAAAAGRKKIQFTVDPDTLTLGDLEDFYDATGVEFDEARKYAPILDESTGLQKVTDDGKKMFRLKLPSRCMTALVWIIERRDNPTLTIDDVRRDVAIGDLVFAGAEPDPHGASD